MGRCSKCGRQVFPFDNPRVLVDECEVYKERKRHNREIERAARGESAGSASDDSGIGCLFGLVGGLFKLAGEILKGAIWLFKQLLTLLIQIIKELIIPYVIPFIIKGIKQLYLLLKKGVKWIIGLFKKDI